MKTLCKFWLAPVLLAALAGCQNTPPAPAPETQAKFKLGVQAYTFRRFTFAETLDKLQALDIHYLQAFPKQDLGDGLPGKFNYSMDEATRTSVLALIKSKNIEVVSYGVIIGKDEAEWRKIFEFAKAMGLQNITSEPPPEALPLVDRLSREFGISVAIHDHPTPNRYANPATVLAAIKPYGANLGFCADTGHWVRSGYDPVESLRLAEGRIINLHFKDLNERGVKTAHDVPWGTGVSNAAGQIEELRRQGFSGIVFMEYEHDTPTLDSDVARSAAYFRSAMAASDADLIAGRVVPPEFTRDPAQLWSGDRGKDSLRWPASPALLQSDLSDADIAAGDWAWRDRVLSAPDGGTLWTKESYGDFVLMLEFRCSEKSNGAVLLRSSDPAHAVKVPLVSGGLPDHGATPEGIINLLKPKQHLAIKPGEWSQLVITARGGRITVSFDHKDFAKPAPAKTKNPVPGADASAAEPGEPKQDQPKQDLPGNGHIGLQSQGTPIEFRNILIDRL